MSTVHICLNDILGVAVDCEVIFYPGDTPFFNGAALAVSGARSIRLDAEGNGSVALLPGRYTVRFSRITGNTDTLLIQVPNDEEDYPLSELICGGNWVLPMRDFLQKSENLGDVADPAAAFDAIKQEAAPSKAGAISLATQAEVDQGTNATKAVTPATFAGAARWAAAGLKVKFLTMADAVARLALTTGQVNVGDLVEQADTHEVYQVLDTTLLGQERGYVLVGSRDQASGLLAGLVGYWPLDEQTGVRADATGNGNDLSDNNGVGYVAGKIGNAASFAGTNSLSSNTIAGFYPSAGFTIACWAKCDPAAYGFQSPISLADVAIYVCHANNSGGPSANIDLGGPFFGINPPDGWDTTVFHHFALTFDANTGSVTLYVDGVAVATDGTATSSEVTSPSNVILGNNYSTMGQLTGAVDEAAVWNRALSPDDIAALYNNGNGLAYPFA